MNYCRFRNDFIKRMANAGGGGGGILPPEYQQVEYLRNYNFAYIETSVPLTNTYYVKVQYIMDVNNIGAPFGSLTTTYPIGAFNLGTGRVILSSNRNATIFPKQTGVKYEFVMYYDSVSNAYRAFIDGVELSYNSDNGNTANNGFSIFYSEYGNYWKGRIISATIKESIDGNTTLDLIPCYRKSDNKPGMYDLVSGTFYTTAVPNFDFTVGQDV